MCCIDGAGAPYLYLALKGTTYIIKAFADGNVLLQKKASGSTTWSTLSNLIEIPKKMNLVSASTPTVASKMLQSNNCDAYQKDHFVTIAFCMETNSSVSSTWKEYVIATINYKPNHPVRTTVINQNNGIAVPLRIDTSGNIVLEVKGIAMASTWLYGGITYGYA